MTRTMKHQLSEALAKRRWISVGVPVALMLVASVAVFRFVRQTEISRVEFAFQSQSGLLFDNLEENFNFHQESVHTIASLYAASDNVSRPEFRAFVQRNLSEYKGIQALEWIPRVSHAERQIYEQNARDDGDPNFRFKQFLPGSPKGKWVASDEKWADEYFPVYFVEPPEGNEKAFGIDLGSNALRREALHRSRDTGRSVVTARITLAQETAEQAGYLIFVPLYANGTALATVEQRCRNLHGFALGVFRLGDIVSTSLQGLDREDILLRVTDESAEGELLFADNGLSTNATDSELARSFEYEVGGRKWKFQFTGTPRYAAARHGEKAWLVLIGGLLITILLGAFLLHVTSHTIEVKRMVDERTQELDCTNQDLRETNAELEQFAYVASHDLKEPLRMVSSYTQLLEEDYSGRLDEDAIKYINYATDGAKRMQILIDDLLRFSRVGRSDSDFQVVDLRNIVDQVVGNIETSIQQVDAKINVGPLPTVRCNVTGITQLFQNIVGNALKFVGEDRPVVRISSQSLGEEWRITIEDNGIGIEPEYRERIFGIFQRLHTRDKYEGTGIGLAICKKVVEHHGGRIWIESEFGKGTAFHVALPMERVDVKSGHNAELVSTE